MDDYDIEAIAVLLVCPVLFPVYLVWLYYREAR